MNVAIVAFALFGIGLYGVLTRRDMVALLASVEVMLGGALVLLVGLGARFGAGARLEAITLVLLAVAAAEAAVGLALLLAIARKAKTTRLDEIGIDGFAVGESDLVVAENDLAVAENDLAVAEIGIDDLGEVRG